MERVSALMDGEVHGSEVDLAIDQVIRDQEARACWDTYHLISDAFRDEYLLSRKFVSKLASRLAQEPTVLAPRIRPSLATQVRTHALSVAASVAAIAIVGWLAFVNNPLSTDLAPVTVVSQSQSGASDAAAPPVESVVFDGDVRAYLFAHQEYSPTTQIQGVAPYIRTVSEVPSSASR